jgi:hypothetical protein
VIFSAETQHYQNRHSRAAVVGFRQVRRYVEMRHESTMFSEFSGLNPTYENTQPHRSKNFDLCG